MEQQAIQGLDGGCSFAFSGATATQQGNEPVDNELLRFGIAALAILAWFVVWELIKPYVTNKRSESEIRDEVRQYFHQEWKAGRLRKD